MSLPLGELEVDGLLCRRDTHVAIGDLRLAEDASAAFEDAPQAAPVAVESARIEREENVRSYFFPASTLTPP